jgi:2'-5' RNA ligase
MPRLFTAIEIPAGVAQSLATLRGGLPRARWIDPENYHLTLRFIGDVDGNAAEALAEALARVHRSAFNVRLVGVEALGTRRPHAIVARAESTPALLELQAEHERICQRLGLPPDGRKYIPHVTLARLDNGPHRDIARDIAQYLGLRGGFIAGPFPVERFALFSARDSVGGGPYLIEEDYPLLRPSSPAEMRAG